MPNLECENLQLSLNELFQRKNNVLNSAVSFRFKRVNTNSNLIKQAACVAPKFIQKIYSSIKEVLRETENEKEIPSFKILRSLETVKKVYGSQDLKEGASSFVKKTDPKWQDK